MITGKRVGLFILNRKPADSNAFPDTFCYLVACVHAKAVSCVRGLATKNQKRGCYRVKDLLWPHVGTEIGINVIRAYRIDSARLTVVHDTYFTVETDKDENTYHIPMMNIVKVLENPNGVKVGGFFKQHTSHSLVVKIGHVVEYAPT